MKRYIKKLLGIEDLTQQQLILLAYLHNAIAKIMNDQNRSLASVSDTRMIDWEAVSYTRSEQEKHWRYTDWLIRNHPEKFEVL